MAWADYHICDLCHDAKAFYDANLSEMDWRGRHIIALCGSCMETHELKAVERTNPVCSECSGRGVDRDGEQCGSCEGSGDAPAEEEGLTPRRALTTARNLICGCVVCICDDGEACSGCGARACGTASCVHVAAPAEKGKT